ncbi:hypothetical protein ACN1C3_09930 [Pseudomonas sp. H11T01]|uniref:hypothetical protein n=1 Tax=Pseudomonas sp. H11T01 TaxID=3402749 RepID=UPI003ACEC896
MPIKNSLSTLLYKLHQNQLAIAAAVEELSYAIEAAGCMKVAEKARQDLSLLDRNLEFISSAILELMEDEMSEVD